MKQQPSGNIYFLEHNGDSFFFVFFMFWCIFFKDMSYKPCLSYNITSFKFLFDHPSDLYTLLSTISYNLKIIIVYPALNFLFFCFSHCIIVEKYRQFSFICKPTTISILVSLNIVNIFVRFSNFTFSIFKILPYIVIFP